MSEIPGSAVCSKCGNNVAGLARNLYVCPVCGKYNRVSPRERVRMLADEGSFTELFGSELNEDPICFPGYKEKLAAAKKKSGENEAVLCGRATFGGHDACIYVMNADFMMASMGFAVGERLTKLFEYATAKRLPVIGYAASGGARMQEGAISLMQMAKVSLAVKRHSDKKLFYLVCLTDPTYGGVTASFASLGDVIIAEPSANVGFAGRRVIEQNTKTKLPDDFQTAEFLLEHGFADDVVERKAQRQYVSAMLALHGGK